MEQGRDGMGAIWGGSICSPKVLPARCPRPQTHECPHTWSCLCLVAQAGRPEGQGQHRKRWMKTLERTLDPTEEQGRESLEECLLPAAPGPRVNPAPRKGGRAEGSWGRWAAGVFHGVGEAPSCIPEPLADRTPKVQHHPPPRSREEPG